METGSNWQRPSARVVAFIAVGALIIGSIGPWESTFLGEVAGTRGDGKATLALAVIAGILLLVTTKRGSGWFALAGALAIIAAIVGIYDLIHLSNTKQELFGREVDLVSPGWGLWVTVVASVTLAGASAALWADSEAES